MNLSRVFKIEEVPIEKSTTGYMRRIVNEKTGASKIGVNIFEISPGAPSPGSHYHTKQESVGIVIEGRAKVTLEGKEYIVEPNSVIFNLPREKHKIENIGEVPFKIIIAYSPIEDDRVEVPEE